MNRIGACTAFLLALSGCVTNTVAPIQSAPQVTLNQARPIQAPTVASRPNPALAPVNKAALSGVPVQLDFAATINADCTSQPNAAIRVVTPPTHGTVTSEPGMDYSNFPKDNQRYDCNVKKSSGMLIRYTSEAGYVGADTAVVDVIYSSGSSVRRTYNISVK